jgi:DNA-binding CsgD family transcriptional regulator
MKIRYHDVEFGLDLGIEPGLADSGDLGADLVSLLQAVGEAAKEKNTVLVLFIDEMQYVEEAELAALISTLHRCAQMQLPVTLVAAGLPQLVGQLGKAKSYAERLFEFSAIGPLDRAAAALAIVVPARRMGADFDDDAVDEILRQTDGYRYFLQEWGKHSWNVATTRPLRRPDVVTATDSALAELDASFFRVRLDRLTPAEKRYLRAMAALGAGPHRSGDIAAVLARSVKNVAPTRSNLIRKGMIYSPAHGDTAFTVPLFDAFMRRAMPDSD